MIKILDPGFKLPEVVPLNYSNEFNNSANKPILVTGINRGDNNKSDYVIKLIGAARMSPEASMRELLSSFLAMQLDVNVVNPAIITISTDFVTILKGKECWSTANKSLGKNYGSQYLVDYKTLVLGQPLIKNNYPLHKTFLPLIF